MSFLRPILHSLSRRFGLLMGVALLVACQPTATPAALPAPADLLSKAAQTIVTTKFVKIKLQLTGAPSFVDPATNRISFVSADGGYVAPDKITANVVAKVLGVAGEVNVVAIGDCQWYKNSILTGGQFINAVFSPGFNAQRLVSSDTGIQSALKAVRDLNMVGRESRNGVDVYHITGTANGMDIESLTVGLIRGTVVNVDVYINVALLRAEEVILVQPDTITASEPKPTRWDLELYDYDVPLAVTPPGPCVPTATPAPTTLPTTEATQPSTVTPVPAAPAQSNGSQATSTIPVPSEQPTTTIPLPNALTDGEATARS